VQSNRKPIDGKCEGWKRGGSGAAGEASVRLQLIQHSIFRCFCWSGAGC